jgi:hypothetical protein
MSFAWLLASQLICPPRAPAAEKAPALDREQFRRYVEEFNSIPTPDVASYIPDEQAWTWMKENVPFFACPDADVERTYYYRWWSYRKHIRQTPAGFVLTEFLRPVKHATDYNAISCALGHHIAEGRWLRDPRYLDQYVDFWLRSGEGGGLQRQLHQYSGWVAAALYDRWLADGQRAFLAQRLDALLADYRLWEKERLLESGLFWQYDVRDGMEESASGSRTAKNARPTINSYMFGNATAIERIARLAGREATAREFGVKARRLQELVQDKLWDRQAEFFKPLLQDGSLAAMREQMGLTPWYFGLPAAGKGFERAWKQVMDPEGFAAPFGLTTVERRHPSFRIAETGDDCQWNGPAWPFSTTVTLKAMANLLADYPQQTVSREDYFRTFLTYTKSQRLTLPDGRVTAWVDENLNPLTGVWQARAMKIRDGTFDGRGDHYNHSGFGDLVITGLAGLRPGPDGNVVVRPLLPDGAWDWFLLEGVPYHGRLLTIVWDRDGQRFGAGRGLRVYADGRLVGSAGGLDRVTGRLR